MSAYQKERAQELGLPEGTGKRYSLADLTRLDTAAAFADMENRWKRGENCPLPSVVETRIIHDGLADLFDAVIITEEQGRERAFRWVGALNTQQPEGEVTQLTTRSSQLIENPSMLRFMRGVVLDRATVDDIVSPIQDGGLVFKPKEEAKSLIGVWEELTGDGKGAFYMYRDYSRLEVVHAPRKVS